MSFITLLIFITVTYFCVEADPIAATTTAAADQTQIDKFMAAVEKAYDEDFAVLLKGLDEDNLAYLKTTTLDGVGSFINYCWFRAYEETNLISSNLTLEDTNDILIQLNGPNTPVAFCNEPTTSTTE